MTTVLDTYCKVVKMFIVKGAGNGVAVSCGFRWGSEEGGPQESWCGLSALNWSGTVSMSRQAGERGPGTQEGINHGKHSGGDSQNQTLSQVMPDR